MTEFKVGDKLWVEPIKGHERMFRPGEVEVTGVSRKWVTVARVDSSRAKLRFNPELLLVDGGKYSSPGRVFLNEGEAGADKQADQAWAVLCRSMSGRMHGVSAADIYAAMKLLKITPREV